MAKAAKQFNPHTTQSNTSGYITVTLKSFLYNLYFNKGYKDAKNGLSYSQEYETMYTMNQVMYERGRQYYYGVKGDLKYGQYIEYFSPKIGKAVNPKAEQMLAYLAHNNSIEFKKTGE